MAVDATKQLRATATIPPRTIDVNKFAESRAPELETLHSIVANRVNNDFRSYRSKRRRTTGFDDRVGKKKHKKRQKLDTYGSKGSVDKERIPRRVRRRIELKENPESGFTTSGDGTKRLRTHVWHAKRFTMTKMWGFYLPLGLHGRGRGSRALLKRFRDGVLVHDASYYGAVQLEGRQDALVRMLTTVFLPCQASQLEDFSVLSGVTYGNAMLHHAGAPFSPAIAPVIYMWRPLHKPSPVTHTNCHDTDRFLRSFSECRRLWIWLHASAFNEGFDVLKLACEKQMEKTGVLINFVSLQGKLANLEVMGSKAFEVLQKIIHPVESDAEKSWHLKKCSDKESDVEIHVQNFSIPENISSSAIISRTVSDPRILSENNVEATLEQIPTKESHLKENADESLELPSSSSLMVEEDSSLPKNLDLWESSKGILPPVEENILCMEKQQKKLAFFCLGKTNSVKQGDPVGGLSNRLCPIMLLNQSYQNGSVKRWSIILPLSWVKPFWDCLISRGAHVIGLREKHWVASEAKISCFPSDFPDCDSYSSYMAMKAAESDEKLKLRPLAMKPFTIPIPPPWESIRDSLNAEAIISTNAQSEESCEITDIGSCSLCGSSFEGFVPRTSNFLSQLLADNRVEHYLIFPHSPDSKNNIAKFIKDDDRLREWSSGATSPINHGQRLCFLRVVLSAYRGGVFEEGAVVCAPFYSDITLYTSRSDDKEEIRISQSSVRSFFKQKPCGMWELQVPEDPVAKASHRCPIGYITSGFVRGSKKPSAIAICEANSLARLRKEQWNEASAKRRKEIYVLVRNLRSTTFRLALATIVLEQQDDDLAFI